MRRTKGPLGTPWERRCTTGQQPVRRPFVLTASVRGVPGACSDSVWSVLGEHPKKHRNRQNWVRGKMQHLQTRPVCQQRHDTTRNQRGAGQGGGRPGAPAGGGPQRGAGFLGSPAYRHRLQEGFLGSPAYRHRLQEGFLGSLGWACDASPAYSRLITGQPSLQAAHTGGLPGQPWTGPRGQSWL